MDGAAGRGTGGSVPGLPRAAGRLLEASRQGPLGQVRCAIQKPFVLQGACQAMIEALRSDEIVDKVGGRFKLCALIQRRLKELAVDGARPLVERDGRTDLEIVIDEILHDKIRPQWVDATDETHRTGPGWPVEV